ncbi:protein HtrL-like [Ruditapes philippinarum]|uniref:protein HtrL-like n=1 Tax=Ruditapes philippinarum TaxID=129788 RepID=UPI00295BB2F1|nr:protein HtrL-like [Ruditapes philippinarum]
MADAAIFYFQRTLYKESDKTSTWQTIPENTTVVTAYIDIGPFSKGYLHRKRSTTFYFERAKAFKFLLNSLIVFTNSNIFKHYMLELRRDLLSVTKVFLIDSMSIRSFQYIKQIQEIFLLHSYPKYYPHTTNPMYTCVTHAKFDFLLNATTENTFKSKYFMWLDVGYYSSKTSLKMFYLSKPPSFDETKIAADQVVSNLTQALELDPNTIFKKKMSIVAAGLLYGERSRIIYFSKLYQRGFRYFLSQNLTNSEQQVIYAIYCDKGSRILKPAVELQYYRAPGAPYYHFLGTRLMKVSSLS